MGTTVFDANSDRLSQLTTLWGLLAQAHASDPAEAEAARVEFLPRYGPPVTRYLLGITADADHAEDLAQEFAVRFLRGDFRHACPERGRFRDYLKTALRHLVAERARRGPPEDTLPPESRLLVRTPAADDADDAAFLEAWRKDLVNRTWVTLERDSAGRGQMLYQVLRLKADEPTRNSANVAAILAERHGRPVTADAARQLLHRARAKFAEFLRAEVAATLPDASPAAVDDELAELGLLVYCR